MDMFPLIVLLFFGSCFLVFALAFGGMLTLILMNAHRASQRRLVDASRFDLASGAIGVVTADQTGDVYGQQIHHTHHHTPNHPPTHHHAPLHTGMTHMVSHTAPPPPPPMGHH